MKKLCLLFAFFVVSILGFSQTILYHENFESPSLGDSVVSSGNPGWAISTKLFHSGLRSDTSKVVANDSTFLTSATFSTVGFSNVILQFSHICKIEFADNAIIQVSTNNGATWTQLVAAQYLGSGQFAASGNKFTSTCYPEWTPGTPTAVPLNSWWKTEQFDLSSIAGNATQVKVRFKLYDGNGTGANGNYGWLIDDILVNGAASELIPPVITLNIPIVQDTVYTTGPFTISAAITDASGIAWAKVAYKLNAAVNYDTIVMTHTTGNTYTCQIPSYTYNNKIWYHVIATDNSSAHNIALNPSSGDKWFYIKQGPTVVIIGTGTVAQNILPTNGYYNYNWGAMLYKSNEINYSGPIDSIAFYVGNAPASYVMNNQKVFIGHTSSTTYGTAQPDTTTMTVAFSGSATFNGAGWYKIKLQNPFYYNGSSNLLIYWTNRDGSYVTGYPTFNYTTTTDYMATSLYSDTYSTVFPTSTGTQTNNRPNLRIAFITTNYGEDAGVSQINEPSGIAQAGPSIPVKVTVKNYGVNTLIKATIGWKLDGVTQTPYNWTGSLAQAVSSSLITIATQSFTTGSHTIKAWTTLPNDSTDENHMNDTTSVSFYGCAASLSGTYTVGGVGADYPAFADVMTALNNCGVSGPTVFKINSGTYNNQLTFNTIAGASATNTITFKPNTGATVVITNNSTTSTIKLNGTGNVIFDGSNNGTTTRDMTITNTSTAASTAAIWMASAGSSLGCINNVIKNCNINAGAITSGTYGIAIGGATIGSTGADNDNNIIQNNSISKAYIGIFAKGSTLVNPGLMDSLKIIGNSLGSVTASDYLGHDGIVLGNGTSCKVEKNTIFNIITTNTTPVGLTISTGLVSSSITKNNINDIAYTGTAGYGARGIYVNTGSATCNLTIANNFISKIGGDGYTSFSGSSPVGMYFDGVNGGLNIYYNSVYMNGNLIYSTATLTTAILFNTTTITGIDLRNNIFQNSMNNTVNTSAKNYAIYSTAPNTSFTTIDHNDYYVSGTQGVIGYLGTAQATLAAWQTATAQDANSIDVLPNFTSTTDLHTFDTGLDGLATPIAGITDDIDGETRKATTPDIGADEFTPLSTDLGILSVIAPISGCGLVATENVTIQLKNSGGTTITTADLYYKLNNGTPVHEVYNGSIAPNATLDYTFTQQADLSATLNYTFKFYLALTGDQNVLNDTLSNYTISNGWDLYTSAYTMGFEPTDDMSAWSKFDGNSDATTWLYPFNSTTDSHSGSNYARYPYNSTNAGNDWLFSRCFKLTAGNTYKIEYWYKAYSSSPTESLDLKVGNATTPAAMTTTLVSMPIVSNTTYQKASATFTPSTTGTYYFGWYAYSQANAWYIYLDDINISILPAQEASIVSMTAPVSGCGLGNENVKIKITNTGGALINGNLAAHYKIIGGSTTVTEAVTQQIAIGSTYDFTFASPADLSVTTHDSTFKIATWIDLTGDPFSSNDSITTDVHSFHVPADPTVISDIVPYGGIAVLHAISADSLYWYSVPTGGTPIATGSTYTTPNLYITTPYYVEAKTGAPSLKFTEIASYRTGTGQTPTYPTWASGADLIEITNLGSAPQNLQGYSCEILGIGARTFALPNIDLPAGQVMVLCAGTGTDSPINFYYNMGGTSDAISSGSASGFVLKDGQSAVVDAVAMNSYAFLPASGVTAADWSGNTASTSGLAGVIRTVSDNNTVADWILSSTTNTQTIGTLNPMLPAGSGGGGCASNRVSDTAYVQLLSIEAGVIEFSSPVSGCTDGTENIIIHIRNNGTSTINPGFSASYITNGSAPVTETVNTQILAGDTLTYTFTTPLIAGVSTANQDSVYNVKAYITLTGDNYYINDTINSSFTLYYTPTAPVVSNVSIPYGNTANLTATSTDTVFWYDSPTSSNEIAIGPTYTSPVLYGNTVYYAEASIFTPGVHTTIGTGTTSESYIPSYGYYNYGWSAMLYKANELNFMGRIDTVSFYVNNTVTAYQMLSQNIYMSETTDAVFPTADKPDPATMTQVFTGDLTWNGPGWYKIALQNPYTYSGNNNLTIYWENMNGTYTSGYPTFNATPTSGNLAKYAYQDASFPTTAGTLTVNRPNITFIHTAKGCSSARVSDTVFVTAIPACDMGVISIDSPNSGIELTNAEQVIVKIKNYGTAIATNSPVNYVINAGTPVTENIAGPINPGDTLIYTFTTPANLSAFTTYHIKAYTSKACDVTHVNDSVFKTVINEPLVYCTSGATSTSDCDISNVTVSTLNNGVALPVLSNPSCIQTYSDFTTLSPALLTAGITYPISVSQCNTSTTFWGSLVNVYLDYNRNGVWDLPQEKIFSSPTSSTIPTVSGTFTVPTTGIVTDAPLRMRVVLDESDIAPACGTYTWGETEDYTAVISPQIPHDAGAISILNPIATQAEGDIVPVKVIVKNFGTDTIFNSSNLHVNYILNGGAPVSTLWNIGSLAPLAVDTITLPNITIPSGQNNICAYTVLAGDSNTINDQTCKAFYAIPNFDAGVTHILQPGVSVMAGSSSPVQVVFKNFGSDTLFAFNLVYTVNGGTPVSLAWSDTLVPNESDTLMLANFTAPSNAFNLCAYTSMATDGDHTNDTLCKSVFGVPSSGLPYYDNFEGTVMWYNVTEAPGSSWELGTPAYGITSSTHSPVNAWDVNLSTAYGANANCKLYTQMFDFTGVTNAKLSFWRNNYTETSFDGTNLEYSTDGTTWQALGTLTDTLGVNWYTNSISGGGSHPAWAGTTNAWIKSEYILSVLNNIPAVQFRFVFRSDGSGQYDGFSIDDFAITIPSPIDAGVEAILHPLNQTSDGGSYSMKVRIKNFGTDTLYTIPLAYTLNGGAPVLATWSDTLVPNDTTSYTFATPFISPAGQYSICAYTTLTGDGDHLNDTICKTVIGIPVFNLPYADNFEGPTYWLSSDGKAQWEWGVPTASVINAAYSPTHVWATNVDGDYVANMNDNLYSPIFNLSPQMDTVKVEFWHWYNTEAGADGGTIQYTLNGGANWYSLGIVGDPLGTNWFVSNINGKPTWNGNSSGWVKSTYSIPKSATFNNFTSDIQFRFNFYSNASTNYNGWAIDDFAVNVSAIPTDAGVTTIVSPANQTNAYSNTAVTVTLKNYGTTTLTSIPVKYTVNNGTPVSEIWTGSLLADATTNYTFTTTFVSPATDYSVCANTSLTADAHNFNDTSCTSIQSLPALYDAGVTKIVQPSGITSTGSNITVTATIKNYGLNTLTSIPVAYSVNAGALVTGTWTGTLLSGDSIDYTIPTPYIGPSLPVYTLCVKSTMSTDLSLANDQKCLSLSSNVGISESTLEGFYLGQNIPNPANDGITTIEYIIPQSGTTRFVVMNSIGELIYNVDNTVSAGNHKIEIPVNNLGSGVYYYYVEFNGNRLYRKMAITK